MKPEHSPLILSHRGNTDGPDPETENTINAIRRAFTLTGIDGIELDVDLTQDGVLVLNHREERRAPPTRTIDYRELLLQYNRPVPTLVEAAQELRALLDRPPRAKTTINIEIKRDPEAAALYPDDYAGMVLDTLLCHLQKDECIISSFDMELLRCLKDLQSGIPVGLILPGDSKKNYIIAATAAVKPDFLAANAALLSRGSNTREFLTEGTDVYVWTVDDDAGLTAFLKDKAVAGVITNQPRRGIALRNSLK